MTSPTPSGPAAPEPDPVRALTRLFLTQLLAVVAVATVIAVVFTLAGRGTGTDVASDNAADGSTSASDSATSPSETSSSSPATSTSPATPAASTTPPATASAAGPEVVRVDVLNQSAGNGSAGRAAADLRGAGWQIGRVDDFDGNVSTTTVYWMSPENRRQARQVAAFLGGVRVQRGFDTLRSGRVTVILVESR
jgi:hypothetical protein